MRIEIIAKILYGVFAVAFLVIGITAFASGTRLSPEPLRRIAMRVAHGDDNALHLIQEFGAFLVFIGLITFWFMRHYELSRNFHMAMTIAWGLIALAHWFDVRESRNSLMGPIINSIPFILSPHWVCFDASLTATHIRRSRNPNSIDLSGVCVDVES